MRTWCNFVLQLTFGDLASKGLRVIAYQGTTKVEAGKKPSHTTEALIGYTACVSLYVFAFILLSK